MLLTCPVGMPFCAARTYIVCSIIYVNLSHAIQHIHTIILSYTILYLCSSQYIDHGPGRPAGEVGCPCCGVSAQAGLAVPELYTAIGRVNKRLLIQCIDVYEG